MNTPRNNPAEHAIPAPLRLKGASLATTKLRAGFLALCMAASGCVFDRSALDQKCDGNLDSANCSSDSGDIGYGP